MGMWIEHEDYPITAWKAAVASDSTRLGYWDWVDSMLESTHNTEQLSVPEAIDYE